MGRDAPAAASSAGRVASQSAAVTRFPVKPFAASDISQTAGGPMIAGRSICSRGQPASSDTKGVSVGPPGISTLTVMPLSFNSSAHTADIDSSADLVAP